MAISPITAQMGRPERIDLGQTLINGMQAYQSNQQSQLMNRQRQQDIQQTDQGNELLKVKVLNNIVKQAKAMPIEQREQFKASLNLDMLSRFGVDKNMVDSAPMDDQSLDTFIAQTDSILGAYGGEKDNIQQGQYVPGIGYVTLSRSGQTSISELTPEQQAKVSGALDAEAKRQATAYGLKVGAGLDERLGKEPELKSAITQAEQDVKLATTPEIERKTLEAKDRAAASAEAVDKVMSIESGLSIYDNMIAEIDNGANTDAFTAWTPTIKDSTRRFEQGARELGLGVISNTTFGALSDAELRLAMETAVPLLQPKAMRQLLIDKKAAQQKLADSMYEYALFLDGGGTKAEWLKQQRALKNDRTKTDDDAELEKLRKELGL